MLALGCAAAFVLSGSVAAGAVVLGCFGAVRGLTPLAASRVRSQRQPLERHGAPARWRGRVRWAGVGLQAVVLVLVLALAFVFAFAGT